MTAQAPAPRGGTRGRGLQAGDTADSARTAGPPQITSWTDLPAHTRKVLELAGVTSAAAWLRLSAAQRASIFGVPPRIQRFLTNLARSAP
jgi:hypothetical protein